MTDLDAGGWLTADQVAALVLQRGEGDGEGPSERHRQNPGDLACALLPLVAARARAGISGFRVGAIAIGRSGAFYAGTNLEFPALGLGASLHAEQAAIAHAHSHGETGIAALAVNATPCGYCRQFMQEIADAGSIPILRPGHPPRQLGALLPDAFGPADLGLAASLFAPYRHRLALCDDPAAHDRELAAAALAAATRSYCPYSQSPCGLALRHGDGTIWAGYPIESAAHNPTLPPWLMAVAAMIRAGLDPALIASAVLVTVAGSIDHGAETIHHLHAIAPIPVTRYRARRAP